MCNEECTMYNDTYVQCTMYFVQEKCVSVGHSTPDMAADIALRAGARKLVLFHLSPRYKPIGAEIKEVVSSHWRKYELIGAELKELVSSNWRSRA